MRAIVLTTRPAFVALLAISLASLVTGFLPNTAGAQGNRSSIELARARMEQGQTYYLQGRFAEAAAEFEAAYEIEPFSAFLYNAGVAYEQAGAYERALEFFGRYLEREPNASDRAAVAQRMERLRAAIEARRAAAAATGTDTSGEAGSTGTGGEPSGGASGESSESGAAQGAEGATGAATPPSALPEDFKSLVSVRTTPEHATVMITDPNGNEVARGESPWSQTLTRGQYHFRIEHPDFNVAEHDIVVEPGKVYVLVINLSQGEFLGYLRVISTPPGADVYIDEREVGSRGQTPFETPMPVGPHRIWIERPGYQTAEQEIEIETAAERTLRFQLERVSYGRIGVTANVRGARIFVDGVEVGNVPWEGDVDAGTRRVRVEADGHKSWEGQVEVRRGQLTPLRVQLRPSRGRGGAIFTFLLAAAAVGAGVAMAVYTDDLMNTLRLERDAGRLSTNDPRIDEGLFWSIGADAAFGVAAILGFIGLYDAFHDPTPPSEGRTLEPRDWAFVPSFDPRMGTVGLTAGGRF